MRKPWLDSYPPGVPAEIDLSEFRSLNAMAAHSCSTFSGLRAFGNMGATITYGAFSALARDFGAFLQGLPGIGTGSRVALMMPNLLQYPIALFGALRAGMIVVNVNPLYTARELEYQLKDSGAEVIVVLENFAHVVERALPRTNIKHVVVTEAGDLLPLPRRVAVNFAVKHVKKLVAAWSIQDAIPFRAALRRGARAPFNEANPDQEDTALLQYTGGTTGVVKGAVLTQRNLLASVLIVKTFFPELLAYGKDTTLLALPLYHIMAFWLLLVYVHTGSFTVLCTNPKDLRGLVKELQRTRPAYFTGVNTLFKGLLNTPGFAEVDFSRLKSVASGGAAIHPAVAERWHAVTGHHIGQGYGLTETTAGVTGNLSGSGFNGTVGLPLPSTETSIRNDDGCELPPGCEGEIWVRGPQVMKGYWNRPEETAMALTADGWLRTGDIGTMDERGYLRITDRKKDMIIVSGFKVFPSQVEGVIAELPGVLDCGVVGIPDERTGEAVKAFVVRSAPELQAETVLEHCRQHLTAYKVPRVVEFRDELPKSPIGKVLRRELRSAGQTVKQGPPGG